MATRRVGLACSPTCELQGGGTGAARTGAHWTATLPGLTRPAISSQLAATANSRQFEYAISLLQVPADRRRLLPQRPHIRAALLDGHQVGGIGAGQPSGPAW
jgi:hypothetical protein